MTRTTYFLRLWYPPGLSQPLASSWRSHAFSLATPFARSRSQLLLGNPGWRCKLSVLQSPRVCPAKTDQRINNTNKPTSPVPFAFESAGTYFHIVGVYVIWAENVGIGVLQDDSGVVDLWEKTNGVRKRRNWSHLAARMRGSYLQNQTHMEECSCICFCSYSLVFDLPLCSSSPSPPSSGEPVSTRRRLLSHTTTLHMKT